MNTHTPWPTSEEAETRVLEIQSKLHRWAVEDSDRRFNDLDNLVCDPAFMLVAWNRVKGNHGARSAGVDGQTARDVAAKHGEEHLLAGIRAELKVRAFHPSPVRERKIPKPNGKLRRLGIATVRDRVVQAALKLVLEPIFEADFQPCSYGYRPGRRTQDAIAEIRHFAMASYEVVFEGDIEACFDEIAHSALMDRMRRRIGDKRVLKLVKAFLKAAILSEDGGERDTITGTPQGGILSPLLANIALSPLDEHFAEVWAETAATRYARRKRRREGLPIYRLVRYADDFVVMVAGTREQAENLRGEVAERLRPMGLRLSETKTKVVHIDEGFDFLGYRIQRQTKRGTGKRYVYGYPSKDSLARIKSKVRMQTQGKTNQPLKALLARLNRMVRGWVNYFRASAASATFRYLRVFVWRRVINWLRRKHGRPNWKMLRRRHLDGWWPVEGGIALFDPAAVSIVRYLYRGTRISTRWTAAINRTSPAT